jgi:hypothetical protein
VNLPDGSYSGFWGGYEFTLDERCEVKIAGATLQNIELSFKTADGIRTTRAKAILIVRNGQGTIDLVPSSAFGE